MKRLIAATLLFVFICGLCLFENFYVEKFFDKTTSSLNVIKTAYLTDNNLEASSFEEVNNRWRKNKNLLTAFINREQINEISDEISSLEYKYEYNRDEFLISLNRIVFRLNEIKTYEKINFYGLL